MPTIRSITTIVTVHVNPDPFVAVSWSTPSGRQVLVERLRLDLRLDGTASRISGEGFALLTDGTPGKTWVRSLLLTVTDLPDTLRDQIRDAVNDHLAGALTGRPTVNVTAGT